jgi:hypothetical protein
MLWGCVLLLLLSPTLVATAEVLEILTIFWRTEKWEI